MKGDCPASAGSRDFTVQNVQQQTESPSKVVFKPIIYDRLENRLKILDQLLLPHKTKYVNIHGTEDCYRVIRNMQVRGAPLIATVAMLSLAVECSHNNLKVLSYTELVHMLIMKIIHLLDSRPTAINLHHAMTPILDRLNGPVGSEPIEAEQTEKLLNWIVEKALNYYDCELNASESIVKNSVAYALNELVDGSKLKVMTLCNTGALATVSEGTALGVIKRLHRMERLEQVYVLETRPYLQGARLTCYELLAEEIPHTLITDSMAAWTMKTKGIDAVFVGADQIAANGDTANKIGTYMLAVLAKFHNVPFYVVAPMTSVNMESFSESCIPIEERPSKELTFFAGQQIAPEGTKCWNPAFDITDATLITAILTDIGCFKPESMKDEVHSIKNALNKNKFK